jgi:putative spermidine/putrescine transport system permease protein
LAERGIDRTLLLLLPGVIFLIALFIYPLLYGLGLSFQPMKGTDPLANYKQFFSNPFYRDTIGITLQISLPPALLNVLLAVPIAYRLRGRVRGKRLLTTVLVIPITFGTVLTAEGMLKFYDPGGGWFNKALTWLHLTDADHAPPVVGTYWGVVISLIISGFPFAFLLILSYLSGIDPSLEAAASTLGASPTRRFWRITLPLLAPGLAITFCLTFVLAFSVFPSAVLVGNPTSTTRVISIAAYNTRTSGDDPLASTMAIIMAVIELVVISLVLFGRSRLYRGATGGKG